MIFILSLWCKNIDKEKTKNTLKSSLQDYLFNNNGSINSNKFPNSQFGQILDLKKNIRILIKKKSTNNAMICILLDFSQPGKNGTQ